MTESDWIPPIGMRLIPTPDSESFRDMRDSETGLPLPPHPGAFGVERLMHIHEGVDLYCPGGTLVHAVETGKVVAVLDFTGESADPPSPWWYNTSAVMVEGKTGVVLYGEIAPEVTVGDYLLQGDIIGTVIPVLRVDKGRPMSMLHLELHQHGATNAYDWPLKGPMPATLLDPTYHLLRCCF